MNNSPLFHLFLAFSKEEKVACRKFLHSPYHNQREDVRQLYDYLQEQYTKSSVALTKERAFAHLFPTDDFADKKMRYTMSFLLKCMEAFLIHREREAEKVANQLLLTRAYRRLNLPKAQAKVLKNAKKILDAQPLLDIEQYENHYQLASAHYDAQAGQTRNAPLNLQEWSQALDLAFLAKKLKQSCFALAHQAVYRVEYDTGLLSAVLDFLENFSDLEKHPAIALYYYFYQAQTTAQHEFYFKKLKTGVVEQSDLLPLEEKRNLYLAAINYCIQRFNKGEEQFLREVFDLYQAGIEQQILFEKGKLSRFTYKNVVGIALRLQEFQWAEDFILNYQDALEKQFKENYTHYNLSKLRFYQKNYTEAMQRLQQVEYDDLFLNLDAKVMLLKIYYELGELDVLESFITSFQRFLQRKKLIGYHQENYGNMIRLTRKMLELNPFDKQEKRKLKQEIESIKALSERDWLLKQLTDRKKF